MPRLAKADWVMVEQTSDYPKPGDHLFLPQYRNRGSAQRMDQKIFAARPNRAEKQKTKEYDIIKRAKHSVTGDLTLRLSESEPSHH